MTARTIEVFSAGCAVCTDTIATVQRAACPSCEVVVLDMRDPEVVRRAQALVEHGVNSPPVSMSGTSAK